MILLYKRLRDKETDLGFGYKVDIGNWPDSASLLGGST